VGGPERATVTWKRPAPVPGVKITGYVVIPYVLPNSYGVTAGRAFTFHSTKTTEILEPLQNGAPFTFTVEALSAAGVSAASKPTNLVIVSLRFEIQTAITKFIEANHVEGLAAAIVMAKPGHPSKPSAMDFFMGDASLSGPAVTATTQFEIGSVTKTFTGALLAYMISHDEISLTDLLQPFAMAGTIIASNGGHQITVGDLITHEAGLPDDPANLGQACAGITTPNCNALQHYSEPLLWQALAQPLALVPGEDWQYSNFAVGTLGTVLANIYDPRRLSPPYGAALANLVTGPLHMDARYLESASAPELATGYQYNGATQMPQRPWDNTGAMAGGGGLISDLHDMTIWTVAETGFSNADSFFLPNTVHQISQTITSTCTDDVCSATPNPFHMGMAWQLYGGASLIYNGGNLGTVAFKDGGTDGMGAVLDLAPEEHYGVVILSNEAGLAGGGVDALGITLLGILTGHAPSGVRTPPIQPGPPPPTLPTCKGLDCD
jgi:serine-type D-Ala-D-Ala carboxypeptidase/endopeptidase